MVGQIPSKRGFKEVVEKWASETANAERLESSSKVQKIKLGGRH